MDITSLGLSSFKLKGKNATVVTDPYDQVLVGLKFPAHTAADIVTVSHDHGDHNNVKVVEPPAGSEKIVFLGPGEYETKGVEVTGIATFHDANKGATRGKNTIYKFEIDGITIVHCGDLGHKLTEEQEDALGEIDVLQIPVGGVYTIDAATAAEIATKLEPAIIIPMHYHRSSLNQKIFGSLSPVAEFLKEIGKEGIAPVSKLKVTKDALPPETEVVVLE